MKTDPRVEKNGRSIIALAAWLEEISQTPDQFIQDDTLKRLLQSQGGICKLTSTERGILGCSLNTLKRIAPLVLNGGFLELDGLRRRALQAITEQLKKRETRQQGENRKSWTERATEAEQALQIALQDSWLLTVAFEKALQQGRYYASQTRNSTIIALCEREQRELRAMFSLRKSVPQFNK